MDADPEVFWEPKIALSKWLISAEKLYDEAHVKELDGDLSAAYRQYMKFLKLIIECFPKHPEYQAMRSTPTMQKLKKLANETLHMLEILKKSMRDGHAGSKGTGRDAIAQRTAEIASSHQPSPGGVEAFARDMASNARSATASSESNGSTSPSAAALIASLTETIQADQLAQLLKTHSVQVLLLDLRQTEADERTMLQVARPQVVRLQPSCLQGPTTSATLESYLPLAARAMFARRDAYDLIVFFDEGHQTIVSSSIFQNLLQAIYFMEFNKIPKRLPVLLVGGLSALAKVDASLVRAGGGGASGGTAPVSPPAPTPGLWRPIEAKDAYMASRFPTTETEPLQPKQRARSSSMAGTAAHASSPHTSRGGRLFPDLSIFRRRGSLLLPVESVPVPPMPPRGISATHAASHVADLARQLEGKLVLGPPVPIRERDEELATISHAEPWRPPAEPVRPPAMSPKLPPAMPPKLPPALPPPLVPIKVPPVGPLTPTLPPLRSMSPTRPVPPPSPLPPAPPVRARPAAPAPSTLPALSFSSLGASSSGVTGLTNLGNTCFMNAVLQCVSATLPLTRYFLDGSYRQHLAPRNKLGSGGVLAEAYASLLRAIWSGEASVVSPAKFRSAVAKFADRFAGHDQHDAHEFMAFFLDGLHEDLNAGALAAAPAPPASSPTPSDAEAADAAWAAYLARNFSVIVSLFQGQLRSRVSCDVCGATSSTFNPFMYLSVPVVDRARCSLAACLAAFFSPEHLDASNAWHCPTCKQARPATKSLDLWRLPDVLIVHLKRFSYHGHFRDKIDAEVACPRLGLDLGPYVSGTGAHRASGGGAAQRRPSTYDLYAITNHYGTLSGGHYKATCFIEPRGQWYGFDDKRVALVSETAVVERASYLLFYKRRDAEHGAP